MGFLAHFLGLKEGPPQADASAAARDLLHKVEQVFPESLKVAMRLIDQRPPAVDAAFDYGAPLHEAFAALVLRAIHARYLKANPAAHPLAPDGLPSLALFSAERVATFGRLIELACQTTEELVYLRGDGFGRHNVLTALEAQHEFAHDPRALLILPDHGDLMIRRDFLLSTAQSFPEDLPAAALADRLADFCRALPQGGEDERFLSAFGYPLPKFVALDGRELSSTV